MEHQSITDSFAGRHDSFGMNHPKEMVSATVITTKTEDITFQKEHPKMPAFEEYSRESHVDGGEGFNPDAQTESEKSQRNAIFDSGTTATLTIENDDGICDESDSSDKGQLIWEECKERIRTLEPQSALWDMQERVRRLVDQNAALANQNAALAIQNVRLAQRVEQSERTAAATAESDDSLSTKVILAFMAGALGWAPPLWFNPRIIPNCIDVGDGDNNRPIVPDREDPSAIIDQIITGLKVSFYFFVFVVDLTDAVVDVAVSFQEILKDDEPSLCLWGVWLLVGTIIGRTVGGLFSVFYKRIDESDRELSYLVSEMTIYVFEDAAAYFFLQVKKYHGIEWTLLDTANLYLTMFSGLLFAAPFLFALKQFTQRLPEHVSRMIVIIWVTQFSWALFAIFFFNEFVLILPVERFDLATRLHYCLYGSCISYLFYHWVRYLFRKDKERRQQQQEELETADEEDDDSGDTTQSRCHY